VTEDRDWKQYDMLAATVRSGMELLLKANIFYYAVTGAILSFYFSRPAPVPWALRLALVLPTVMALALAALFLKAALSMRLGERDLRAIADRLGLVSYPNATALRDALIVSAVLLLIVAAGLVALMVWASALAAPEVAV
jgi:hypothetical protein